jgi:hypothetical protein
MSKRPDFWKTRLEEIEIELQKVTRGKSRVLGYSAGSRKIWLAEYGEKPDFKRKSNYNSACGAGNPSYYAQKGDETRPVVLIAGAAHGCEMEGIVGVLNLINVLETGRDFRGKEWDYIYNNWSRFRILLIPCLNPDGRDRFPFDIVAGETLDTLAHYSLGLWKDGTACKWPECKAIHPVLDEVSYLGSYYNDHGVNVMHDNFFNPMANEAKLILKLADEEAPDFSVLLHGGGNNPSHFKQTTYVPFFLKVKAHRFEEILYEYLELKDIQHEVQDIIPVDGDTYPPPSFNLSSAIHHVSGGLSLLFESNSGLDAGGLKLTCDQILDCHLVLFEQMLKFVDNKS